MRLLIPPAAVVAALALVPLAPAANARTAATPTIKVQAGEFFFKLSTNSVAKPETVVFSVANVGHVAHDFKIDGKTTPLIQPGKSAKLTVKFARKGSFPYLCTVPGHAQAGMKGVFAVR
jgi:uncharacterized cupredoxin-like copper-binding protein